jgi:hypothetical protein
MQPMRLVRSPLPHKFRRNKSKRNYKKSEGQNYSPEPIDEKDDAQAFTSLILVVAVKLRELRHYPTAYAQHSEREADEPVLENLQRQRGELRVEPTSVTAHT